MYSLIRVWIGAKLAQDADPRSVVVRTTRASDSPSTPSLYWMPKTRDPVDVSTNWKPRRPRQVKPTSSSSETTHVSERDAERQPRAARRRRQEAIDERADERQERDERQDRDRADVHRQPRARSRYEPAMTISPMAMPRA